MRYFLPPKQALVVKKNLLPTQCYTQEPHCKSVSQLCSGAGRFPPATPSTVWHIYPVPGTHTHTDFVWTDTESALSLCSKKIAARDQHISPQSWEAESDTLKDNVPQAQHAHYHP